MINLDALEALLAKATPGPWKHWTLCKWDDPKACGYDSREHHRGEPYYATGPRTGSSEAASADAAAIVALMNAAPALLAELEAHRRVTALVRTQRCCAPAAKSRTNAMLEALEAVDAATNGGG